MDQVSISPTALEFEIYHRDNSGVYDELVKLAFEVKRSGRKKTSMTLLVNRLRWYFDIEIFRGEQDFKINDHFSPYYARLLMAEYPGLDGLFNTRSSDADDWIELKIREMAA